MIPRDHKVDIANVKYIRLAPYHKSYKTAWYWKDHGEELVRTTKGLTFFVYLEYLITCFIGKEKDKELRGRKI
jgi:hypothetical protein